MPSHTELFRTNFMFKTKHYKLKYPQTKKVAYGHAVSRMVKATGLSQPTAVRIVHNRRRLVEGEQFDAQKLLEGAKVVQSKCKNFFVLLFDCSIILFV